jgi:hypothetical protein
MTRRAYGKNGRQRGNRIEAQLQQQLTKERSNAEALLAKQVGPVAFWIQAVDRRFAEGKGDDVEGWKTIVKELSLSFDDDDVNLATLAHLATFCCSRSNIEQLHALLVQELWVLRTGFCKCRVMFIWGCDGMVSSSV